MATEPSGQYEDRNRGVKRRSHSPVSWQRPQKAPRANYEDGRRSTRLEFYGTPERAQKEQVRLNQIQENEKSREWIAQEDDFVLKQAKKKAEIRVKDNRARPIDLLAVGLRMIDTTRNHLDDEFNDAEIEIMDPGRILEGISQEQLAELEKDIDTFLQLEKNAQNKEYWRVSQILDHTLQAVR